MNERKSASVWKFHDDCWCCKCASSELLWHLNRFMCFLQKKMHLKSQGKNILLMIKHNWLFLWIILSATMLFFPHNLLKLFSSHFIKCLSIKSLKFVILQIFHFSVIKLLEMCVTFLVIINSLRASEREYFLGYFPLGGGRLSLLIK